MSSMVRFVAKGLLASIALGVSAPAVASDAAQVIDPDAVANADDFGQPTDATAVEDDDADAVQPDGGDQPASPVQGAAQWDAANWDTARKSLVASEPSPMGWAIARWQQLTAKPGLYFSEYASFLVTDPGFPDEAKLRTYAENRLAFELVEPERLIAYFDRFPPLTNPARAQYAIALAASARPEWNEVARAAWRGGQMSPAAEATLFSLHGQEFTPDDHDARMDALLWQGDAAGAARQLGRTSQARQFTFSARLYALQGTDPRSFNSATDTGALADPGFVFNLVRMLRKSGRIRDAADLAATRPRLASLPHDQTAWVSEMLDLARKGGSRAAQRIAAGMDDAFAPGADISALSFKLRDDYTSLMWLGGTKALTELGEPANAAPLFYRYGAAARTPQTRSKGFYWAGLAAQQAGDAAGALGYFQLAAAYPERFYGQLALGRLGQPMPVLAAQAMVNPSPEQRAAFLARPLTKAVREVARDAPWAVGIRFYREIASQAQTEAEMQLVAELARDIGRRDLAVILGEEAGAKGFREFNAIAYPTLVAPPATDWTMVHAIARQESQFANNAISHAGAKGLMQLMPGTAREQAGKIGIQFLSASLIDNPDYNMRLGDAYFARLMDYYAGSYPLSVAAYNAGPGNVNKWLAANGDPRTGAVRWVDWIERIPLSETRNYVQRVLENAVVYEAMHPDRVDGEPRTIGRFLGSFAPG